jgi:hypothetical protein
MKINSIIQHIIFISVFGTLAAKLEEGAQLSSLLLINPLLILIATVYGMFVMSRLIRQDMDELAKKLDEQSK